MLILFLLLTSSNDDKEEDSEESDSEVLFDSELRVCRGGFCEDMVRVLIGESTYFLCVF